MEKNKFKVGDKVIILDKRKGFERFHNQIGIIDFLEYFSKSYYYAIKCDNDSLNKDFQYRGEHWHNADYFFNENSLHLANINKRIVQL